MNASFVLENGMQGIAKLKDAIEKIYEAASDIFCFFVPNSDVGSVKHLDTDLWEEYVRLVDSIKTKENVIYNPEPIQDSYLEYVSGYYGSSGVLAHKCSHIGKPIMLMRA